MDYANLPVEQDQAYKRGVVLGLTLAEIVLLVVFCLLLVMLPYFAMQETASSSQSPDERRTEQEQLAQIDSILEKPASNRPVSEAWRLLVWARETITTLRARVVELEHRESARQSKIEEVRTEAEQLRRQNVEQEKRIERLITQAKAQSEEKAQQSARIAALEERLGIAKESRLVEAGHRWPPIIRLSEADGYFFELGSARLTETFVAQLRSDVVARILELIERYDVDVIEVIGHTDEVAVSRRVSNLDQSLLRFLNDPAHRIDLRPADNAGLGMARAAAVARVLRSDPRLADYRILPLSGAQAIDTSGEIATGNDPRDVRERRRIEIRVRRSVSRQR